MAIDNDINDFIRCLERAQAYMKKYGARKASSEGPGLNLSDAISLTAMNDPEATTWAERLSDPKQRYERYTWPKVFHTRAEERSRAFRTHMPDVDFRKVTEISEMIAILKRRR